MRNRRKVSGIGAITISPKRRRLNHYKQLHTDGSINEDRVIAFLRQLLRHLRGKVIVIWDNLAAHKGKKIKAYLANNPRLHVERLPPYAPELNAVEYDHSHTKLNDLANYCPENVDQLHDRVNQTLQARPTQQQLLRSFVHATGLPIRL